jgi:hypothetical protein
VKHGLKKHTTLKTILCLKFKIMPKIYKLSWLTNQPWENKSHTVQRGDYSGFYNENPSVKFWDFQAQISCQTQKVYNNHYRFC